jgi:Rad3-related DNA helicase
MDIMSYYPYPTVREGHEEALRLIEQSLPTYDVILLVAPPGTGKTVLRRTLAYWYKDVAMTVPNNSLMQQEVEEFPQTHKIFGKDSGMYFCEHCYNIDKASLILSGIPVLAVPHGYLAHRLQRKMWIADEGHKLVEFNQELQSTHVWRKDVEYPRTIYSRKDFERWLTDNIAIGGHKFKNILEKIQTDDYMIKREMAYLRGKLIDRIRLIPLSPHTYRTLVRGVSKIVLMSATLSEEDVWDLGVSRDRKVLRIELPSIIPAERRPLERAYVGKINYYNIKQMSHKLAQRVKEIADYHAGVKGIIHATYDTAHKMRDFLKNDPRFMFHSKSDAKEVLNKWMTSPASEGKVFIASGFEEGIDLKGSEYEWQAIARVPWPSLADPAVRKKTDRNERWYIWKTLQKIIQAYGRICRAADDYGVTYVLDEQFEKLIAEAKRFDLIPKYFEEVL